MSKNEKIKEQIGWLKVVFGILSAVLVSMAGWLAANYNRSDENLVIITLCLIVLNAILIMVVNKSLYQNGSIGGVIMEWTLIVAAIAIAIAFGYTVYEINNHPTT